jgi:NAD(P)-dependent dehydrogenase (short-subunit alcohol dehydrogenase family)
VSVDQPVAVITGATGGIGRYIARGLARAGWRLILICRQPERAEAARAWLAAEVLQSDITVQIADLALLSATRKAGLDIVANNPRIDLLVNNAGVFETKRTTTTEGIERVLAVNHLSPFVLTQTLLPSLLAAAPARIVNVGSSTSDRAQIDPDNFVLGKRWTMIRAYSQSKLALMITTFELAKRLAGTGVTANVAHPGLVATGLVRSGGIIGLAWRCLAMKALTEEQGAETPLHVALAPELQNTSGVYFKRCRPAPPNPRALDPALRARVWAATEQLTALSDHPDPNQTTMPAA